MILRITRVPKGATPREVTSNFLLIYQIHILYFYLFILLMIPLCLLTTLSHFSLSNICIRNFWICIPLILVSRPHRSQIRVTDWSSLLSSSSGYIGVFEVDRTALMDHSSPSDSSGVRPAPAAGGGNRVSVPN